MQTASHGAASVCACHGTPLSAPAQVRAYTETLPWSDTSLVPSSTCDSGRNRHRTGTQAWAPTPHSALTQPWGHGNWPCPIARCGGKLPENSLVFPGWVNRTQSYHKRVLPHG